MGDIGRAIEYNNEGVKYYQEGKIKQAIESFRKAISVCPEFASAYHHLGLIYYKMSNYAEATACFKKARDLGMKSPQLDYYYELARKEMKDSDPLIVASEYTEPVKETRPTQRLCPNCGEPVDVNFRFCPNCRFRLEKPRCPSCNAEVKSHWKICPYCGVELKNND